MSDEYLVHTSQVFIFLFVMLGPLRIIGPFCEVAENLNLGQIWDLSIRSVIIAFLTLSGGALLGSFLLEKWMIRPEVLLLTGGIIFFLVALLPLLPLPSGSAGGNGISVGQPTGLQIALRLLITPYGMSTAIVLMAVSRSHARTLEMIGFLLLIMTLNLIAMNIVRWISKTPGILVLQMLEVAMSVLQAALALEIILRSWTMLG